MKWILFDDMMPTPHANVFVYCRGSIDFMRWLPEYNREPAINWPISKSPISQPIYKYECWAPEYFFDEYLPMADPEGFGSTKLHRDQDWFKKNADNPLLQEINDITEELNKNEAYLQEQTIATNEHYPQSKGCKHYAPLYVMKQYRINYLMKLIDNPNMLTPDQEDEIFRKSLEDYWKANPFPKELLSNLTPKDILTEKKSIFPVRSGCLTLKKKDKK